MRSLICNPARLDGFKGADALLIGGQPSKAAEGRVNRFLLMVVRMVVFACGIGLPDLDHRIVHENTVTIVHAADEVNALAFSLRRHKSANRAAFGAAQMKEGACGLRGCRNEFVRFQTGSPPGRAE